MAEGSPGAGEAIGPSGLGTWMLIAAFCAACWLAVGLVVTAVLVMRESWLAPTLIGVALLAGVMIGSLPTMYYRWKAGRADGG
jgi:phosphatidylglycerophosphate synthase